VKLSRKVGATSQILQIFVADSSSATGAGLTGLVFNSAGLTAYYHRDTDTTATAISLVTMTVGTFTSSGFKEIDAANMPGWYAFCPPDAALAAGASSVGFHLKGATNMAPLPVEVDLGSQVDVTAWNGTAVASPHTAGYPVVTVKDGTGTGEINTNAGAIALVDLVTLATTTTTATNVTTVNGLAANVITAAATAADFGTEVGTAVWASGTRTLTSLAGLTVDTVTTLTNLPTIPANWLTAAGTAADFGTEVGTAVWASGTRTLTSLSGLTVDTVTTLTNLPAITANWLTAAGTAADFTTEIQAGLATAASIAALNNLSAAQVNTEVDTALADVGLTTTVTGRIDAAVSSRMATYTQPTGFLAATFPTDPADQSLVIAATDAILTAVGTRQATFTAGTGITFPTNFADLAVTATTGRVTVGTNADKTGYSLATAPPTAAENATAWGARVIGNARTADMYLQGLTNKIDFAADGLSWTLYGTDDATPIATGSATRLGDSIGGLRGADPA
jgi:hypothetical protein